MKEPQAEVRAIAAQLHVAQSKLPVQSAQSASRFDSEMQRLWQRLEDQMHYVNQLAADQEAAILRLKAIVQQIKRDRDRVSGSTQSIDIRRLFEAGYLEPNNLEPSELKPNALRGDLEQSQETIAIPYVEKTEAGELRIGTRSIDLSWQTDCDRTKSQATGGQVFCDRAASSQVQLAQSWGMVLSQGAKWGAMTFLPLILMGVRAIVWLLQAMVQFGITACVQLNLKTAQSARRSKPFRNQTFNRQHVKQPSIDSAEIFPSAQAALTLTLGAALLRILLDRVSQLYPALSLMSILLMLAPAAVAIYRSTVAPQSGFLWGCRLTLIMIGLLLGGKV
ncbi:hypothetical protein NDI45_04730 [Leptolyngbya sp. GB1-A1]|uniref:hypothetical protein n=1 Tax=Leptolyngbya sp. GB1-A1 TaxID=2933908 RepID=UPI003299B316